MKVAILLNWNLLDGDDNDVHETRVISHDPAQSAMELVPPRTGPIVLLEPMIAAIDRLPDVVTARFQVNDRVDHSRNVQWMRL